MQWLQDLYLSDALKTKKRYYQFLIQHTKKKSEFYCLTPAVSNGDLIDIIRCDYMKKRDKQYPKQLIIGLADTKGEAITLAGKILCDLIEKTGGTDVKAYFLNQ